MKLMKQTSRESSPVTTGITKKGSGARSLDGSLKAAVITDANTVDAGKKRLIERIPNFEVFLVGAEELEGGGGYVNGFVVVGGKQFNVGGGWIHSAHSARQENNSRGVQPEDYPDMEWPGAVSAGDWESYSRQDMGDIQGLAKALGVSDGDIDELVKIVKRKSYQAWAEQSD